MGFQGSGFGLVFGVSSTHTHRYRWQHKFWDAPQTKRTRLQPGELFVAIQGGDVSRFPPRDRRIFMSSGSSVNQLPIQSPQPSTFTTMSVLSPGRPRPRVRIIIFISLWHL